MQKKLGSCTILNFVYILAWEMVKEAEEITENGKKRTRSRVEFQCQPASSQVASVPVVCRGSLEISTETPGFVTDRMRDFLKGGGSQGAYGVAEFC